MVHCVAPVVEMGLASLQFAFSYPSTGEKVSSSGTLARSSLHVIVTHCPRHV
jgi:hypothetical protein